MRPHPGRFTVTVLALAAAAFTAFAACTSATESPAAFPTVRIVNSTAEPIAYMAVASESVPLIDPVPEAPVGTFQVVAAGTEQVVPLLDLDLNPQPSGIAFFLYRLTPARDSVHFSRLVMFATSELRRTSGRATIPSNIFENR